MAAAHPGRREAEVNGQEPKRRGRDQQLITGANQGPGYETARRKTGLGHTVLCCARTLRMV